MKYAASFVGWSNTGKTTLMESLIRALKDRGYTVAALKQSHVPPGFDSRGKDSDRFFHSGAYKVAYLSPEEGFLRFRRRTAHEDITRYFHDCDILICEGYRIPGFPCFEVIGAGSFRGGLKCEPEDVAAYILSGQGDEEFTPYTDTVPAFSAQDPDKIICFMEEIWKKK